MRKTLFTVFIFLATLSPGFANQSTSYDRFGKITPSEVYDLWLGINKNIFLLTENQTVSNQLKTMRLKVFSGKIPGDVLSRVVEFRNSLNRMRQKAGLKQTKVYTEDSKNKVTPSIVFVNSGHLADATVELVWAINRRNLSYRENATLTFPSGKTPSNVFGLVDLANRRLALLLKKSSR